LDGWHQRDLIVWLEDLLAVDKIDSNADEKIGIPFFEAGKTPIKLGKQIAHGGAFWQFDAHLAVADDLPELGKELCRELQSR
jgi:hypothetical protein